MHTPRAFAIHELPQDWPLRRSHQADYLHCYLHDLGVRWALEEPLYFDRDYLSEFASFYSTSAAGYSNACRRLTFFHGDAADSKESFRASLEAALGGNVDHTRRLTNGFRGFSVLRPIPGAPLGRTVLPWYPQRADIQPRIVEPVRNYRVHVAGLELSVEGIAWQQQDNAVGACATVAIWTMVHSSAFDEHHSIPTTATITSAAHLKSSLGMRLFPSKGLNIHQVLDAIQELGLAPIVSEGDVKKAKDAAVAGFSEEIFGSSCAAFIRAGYPVLLLGIRGTGHHAICAVGFRPGPRAEVPKSQVVIEDSAIENVYIHDDNLGPNVRCRVRSASVEGHAVVELVPEAPPDGNPGRPHENPLHGIAAFRPLSMVVAVHNDIRATPDDVNLLSEAVARRLSASLGMLPAKGGLIIPGLTLGLRYMRLSDYLGEELACRLAGERLSAIRLAICESLPPMSLYLAVARVGLQDMPLLDILYDTTDSMPNMRAFAHVPFHTIGRYLVDDARERWPDLQWDRCVGIRVDP